MLLYFSSLFDSFGSVAMMLDTFFYFWICIILLSIAFTIILFSWKKISGGYLHWFFTNSRTKFHTRNFPSWTVDGTGGEKGPSPKKLLLLYFVTKTIWVSYQTRLAAEQRLLNKEWKCNKSVNQNLGAMNFVFLTRNSTLLSLPSDH